MKMDFNFTTKSPADTIALGRKIGEQLKGGEIIGLIGQLGSGKTHLIKGIAAGAGAEKSKNVTSPTFVIVNEYKGRLDIYHIDAYRLNSVSQFEMIGFDDYCYPDSVVLIEWADKVASVLEQVDYILIELFSTGKTIREIHVKNTPNHIGL